MRRFILTVMSLFVIYSCKKNDPTPVVVAKDLTCNVTSTNVTVHGGHDGTITVTVLTGNGDYVFSLNTTNTNIDGKFTSLSAGTYSLKVTDAENKEFTKDVTITEPSLAPSVETGTATVTSLTDVTLNGKINPNGYVTTSVYFEYGSTTSYGTKINLSNISGSTLTSVSGKITNGLSTNNTYHYRLVAINSGGTAYGNDSTFSTYVKPTINSVSTSNIGITGATLNCDVNPQGSLTKIYFEYGTTIFYGSKTIEYTLSNTNSNVTVNSTIINLTPNTTYHYRLVATNSGGTIYSNDITFTTLQVPAPTVSNISFSNITPNSATLSFNVNTNSSTTTVYFEYGETTSYGKTIELNNVTGDVVTSITNLTQNTTYSCRLTATNAGGNTIVDNMTFSTPSWKVGDEMFGGVVFYIDGSGQHGKVVSKTDESTAMTWTNANNGVLRNGATWVLPKWDEIKLVYDNETTLQISSLSIIYRYWTNSDVTYTSASTFKTPNLKYSDLKTEEYLIRFITTF